MENKSGIIPTEYKVLVAPEKVEEKTKGGLYIPQEAREKEQAAATKGRIVAISPLAFSYDEWPSEVDKPKVGQDVAFSRYAGVSIKGYDDEDYRIISDRDVVAIYEVKQ